MNIQASKPLDVLKQFVRRRDPVERCDLCGIELTDQHEHLVEPATRKLNCACEACSILFSNVEDSRFRRVPRRSKRLEGFEISDMQWSGLQLPIQLAFFFYSTPDERVIALYPSPAGATESLLPLDAWGEIVEQNPALEVLRPDVEALLVNRVGERREYFITPLDECYRLVGLIRSKWRGLSGGTEAWNAIAAFFDELGERSGERKEARANA